MTKTISGHSADASVNIEEYKINETCVTGLSPSSANNSTLKNTLFKQCKQELNKLANGTCVKFRHLAEQMLKDPVVQKAESPLMQELKWNITNFLQIYPTFMKYDLYEPLLEKIGEIAIKYYYQEHSKDFHVKYVLILLKRLDFDPIYDDYGAKFKTYVNTKLLPEFEEFKKSNTNNETTQWETVCTKANELKKCRDYNCYDYEFRRYYGALLTSRDQLLEVIAQETQDLNIFNVNAATIFAKGILTDPRLSQLNSSEQQLSLDLKDYIHQYDSNHDVNKLNDLWKTFNRKVLWKYYINGEVPEQERNLLTQIFDDQGYANFEIEREKRLKRFSERLFKESERFKASLNREELEKEKPLLDWLKLILS